MEAPRWLSLSPDTFKPGHAQLSALIAGVALISANAAESGTTG
jgi:hypothetical protein